MAIDSLSFLLSSLSEAEPLRRMFDHRFARTECLRRARECEWLAEVSPTETGAAYFFDRARLWRSLALVAREDPGIAEGECGLDGRASADAGRAPMPDGS
jgi:hypothetical protein